MVQQQVQQQVSPAMANASFNGTGGGGGGGALLVNGQHNNNGNVDITSLAMPAFISNQSQQHQQQQSQYSPQASLYQQQLIKSAQQFVPTQQQQQRQQVAAAASRMNGGMNGVVHHAPQQFSSQQNSPQQQQVSHYNQMQANESLYNNNNNNINNGLQQASAAAAATRPAPIYAPKPTYYGHIAQAQAQAQQNQMYQVARQQPSGVNYFQAQQQSPSSGSSQMGARQLAPSSQLASSHQQSQAAISPNDSTQNNNNNSNSIAQQQHQQLHLQSTMPISQPQVAIVGGGGVGGSLSSIQQQQQLEQQQRQMQQLVMSYQQQQQQQQQQSAYLQSQQQPPLISHHDHRLASLPSSQQQQQQHRQSAVDVGYNSQASATTSSWPQSVAQDDHQSGQPIIKNSQVDLMRQQQQQQQQLQVAQLGANVQQHHHQNRMYLERAASVGQFGVGGRHAFSDRDSVSTLSRFNQFDDRRSFTMRSQFTAHVSRNKSASKELGFVHLTCEALKRMLGLTGHADLARPAAAGAAARHARSSPAGSQVAPTTQRQPLLTTSSDLQASATPTLAAGGEQMHTNISLTSGAGNDPQKQLKQQQQQLGKVTIIDSGEDYYFKRKVFKYQLVILRLINLILSAIVLLSPVVMLLIPKMEPLIRGGAGSGIGGGSLLVDQQQAPESDLGGGSATTSSGAPPTPNVVTHAVGLAIGPNRHNLLAAASSRGVSLHHFQQQLQQQQQQQQPQWRISECQSSDCDGPLIGFVIRLIMLIVAHWAIFFRSQTSTLPRVDIQRCFLISLALLVTIAYWLFFIFRVFDKRYNDFELHYMTIVQFSISMLESLLVLHYLALLLTELKHRKKVYCLKVVRSPDGEAKYYSCGTLSIQKCAQFVLDKYHRDFKCYDSYAQQLLELEDELARELDSDRKQRQQRHHQHQQDSSSSGAAAATAAACNRQFKEQEEEEAAANATNERRHRSRPSSPQNGHDEPNDIGNNKRQLNSDDQDEAEEEERREGGGEERDDNNESRRASRRHRSRRHHHHHHSSSSLSKRTRGGDDDDDDEEDDNNENGEKNRHSRRRRSPSRSPSRFARSKPKGTASSQQGGDIALPIKNCDQKNADRNNNDDDDDDDDDDGSSGDDEQAKFKETTSDSNKRHSKASESGADQSSDATTSKQLKESSLETVRAASFIDEPQQQQQQRQTKADIEISERPRSVKTRPSAGAAAGAARDETESVRSARSRRSTGSRMHGRSRTTGGGGGGDRSERSQHSHHHHHHHSTTRSQRGHEQSRERSSSRARSGQANDRQQQQQLASSSYVTSRGQQQGRGASVAANSLDDHERKLKRRKLRLLATVEDSFEQVKLLNEEDLALKQLGEQLSVGGLGQQTINGRQQQQQGPTGLEASQAARSLYPNIARALQKYLRLTKQTGRHNLASIYEHLSKCLLYKLSARTFLEKFTNFEPVWQQSETSLFANCRLGNANNGLAASSKQRHFDELELNSWSLVCDTLLSRQIDSGTFFLLKQGQVSLLVSVAKLPHLVLSEQVIDQSNCKFTFGHNSDNGSA